MATNLAIRSATPGLGKLAQAIGQSGNAYQAGYDAELKSRSALAQAMASAQANEALARQRDEETNAFRNRPSMIEESLAAQTGASIPQLQAVRETIKTGVRPMQQLAGPMPDGGNLPDAPLVDDATEKTLRTALARALPMFMAQKDIKPDDLAKASQLYRENDLGDAILRGELKPGAVGASQAAVAAKPLFNSDANGAVLDLFGGALDTDNPMAKSTIGLKGAQSKQAIAAAAENYAQAERARAEAANARAEGGGAGKAPTGYRWNGGALEPIPGGPADPATKGAKLAKPPTEGQAKALMLGSRMAVADEVLGELEKAGESQPGRVKQAVETVPLVGGALGMGVNSLPPALGGPNEMQQQVEQAQRDFINAVLRRESGAAIADSEFRNAQRQYFPQPGDSPAVRRQKAANRQTAIAGFKAEFGEQSMPQFEEIVSTARRTRSAPEGGWDGGPQKAAPKTTDPKGRPSLDSFNKR